MLTRTLAAALVTLLVACGGAEETEVDDDMVIDETDTALSVEPGGPSDGDADADDDDRAHDCDDGDRDHHKKHKKHKWKVLDRLDGVHDKTITIAALPAGLPDRLLAKLDALDTNDDGLVTKDEVKAHRRAKKHKGPKRDKD